MISAQFSPTPRNHRLRPTLSNYLTKPDAVSQLSCSWEAGRKDSYSHSNPTKPSRGSGVVSAGVMGPAGGHQRETGAEPVQRGAVRGSYQQVSKPRSRQDGRPLKALADPEYSCHPAVLAPAMQGTEAWGSVLAVQAPGAFGSANQLPAGRSGDGALAAAPPRAPRSPAAYAPLSLPLSH